MWGMRLNVAYALAAWKRSAKRAANWLLGQPVLTRPCVDPVNGPDIGLSKRSTCRFHRQSKPSDARRGARWSAVLSRSADFLIGAGR